MKYKEYIVFGIDEYYPHGGLSDIIGDFDALEEAIDFAKKCGYDYKEIVNRDTWEFVSWQE